MVTYANHLPSTMSSGYRDNQTQPMIIGWVGLGMCWYQYLRHFYVVKINQFVFLGRWYFFYDDAIENILLFLFNVNICGTVCNTNIITFYMFTLR